VSKVVYLDHCYHALALLHHALLVYSLLLQQARTPEPPALLLPSPLLHCTTAAAAVLAAVVAAVAAAVLAAVLPALLTAQRTAITTTTTTQYQQWSKVKADVEGDVAVPCGASLCCTLALSSGSASRAGCGLILALPLLFLCCAGLGLKLRLDEKNILRSGDWAPPALTEAFVGLVLPLAFCCCAAAVAVPASPQAVCEFCSEQCEVQ
jgi:hypothetical protein